VATFLHIGDSVGTVERGKIADLVLIDADPLMDITNTRRISAVVMRGEYYDGAALKKIRAQVLAAPDIRVDEWGRK
jgi:imidazolonepropionase-like amidohydrolase